MHRRLPPLHPLRAFEAAARLRSFSAAANELSLTHGAISKAVRGLEEYFGSELLKRQPRGVEPTPLGRELAFVLQRFFDELGGFVEEARAPASPRRLRVSAVPSLGVAWLLPRLPDFVTAHPDFDLEVRLTARFADFEKEETDIGIRYGLGQWKDVDARPLMDAPLVVAAASGLGLPSTLKPCDLRARQDLLHDVTDHDWRRWFARHGVEIRSALGGVRLEDLTSLLQAAREGSGIALVPLPLVARDIEEGRLRRLFSDALPNERAYYLVAPPDQLRSPAARAFSEWARSTADGG